MSTQRYQAKTGIEVTQSLKPLHHPPAHTCQVCRTFQIPLCCTMFAAIIISASVFDLICIMILMFLSIGTLARLHGKGTVHTI